MYSEAREKALDGKDVDARPVSVCLVCGHTVIGDVPDRCPVCAAPKDQYKTF
jgi:rubrerythrin